MQEVVLHLENDRTGKSVAEAIKLYCLKGIRREMNRLKRARITTIIYVSVWKSRQQNGLNKAVEGVMSDEII